ncbi:MAG: hypothetical protein ACR2LC_09565 [Pyrinomonadaceae bacterium]
MPQQRMTSAEFKAQGRQSRGTSSALPGHDYKADFLQQIALAGLRAPIPEFKFDAKRKWRFDWAYFQPRKIAIEYEGGILAGSGAGVCRACGQTSKGAHARVTGILRDIEKYTEAALAGWLVIRITPVSVRDGTALRYVQRALTGNLIEANNERDR